jgi:hypothetical protein
MGGMSHAFREIETLSVFRYGDLTFQKLSEDRAVPIGSVKSATTGELPVWFDASVKVEIVSGQTRLKIGSPLYRDDGSVVGRVMGCDE